MDIVKACKIAAEQGCCIARVDKFWHIMYISKIKPTDLDERLCEVMRMDGTGATRGWQPKLEDLIAQDWIVVD